MGDSLNSDTGTDLETIQKLDQLTLLNTFTNVLIYGGLIVGFIAFTIGIYQISKRTPK